MEMKQILGQNLKKYRKARGLKQSELARMIGVSMYTVSVWERGKQMPEVKAVEALSRIFSVPPQCLYLDEDDGGSECLEDTLAETVEAYLKGQREFCAGEYVVKIIVSRKGERGCGRGDLEGHSGV